MASKKLLMNIGTYLFIEDLYSALSEIIANMFRDIVDLSSSLSERLYLNPQARNIINGIISLLLEIFDMLSDVFEKTDIVFNNGFVPISKSDLNKLRNIIFKEESIENEIHKFLDFATSIDPQSISSINDTKSVIDSLATKSSLLISSINKHLPINEKVQ